MAIRLSILILIVSVAAANTVAAQSSLERPAIEATAQAFVTAYDAGNAAAIAALWTPDGEYTVGGQAVRGRAEIEKIYGEFFRANPGAKMQVKIDSVRNLAPNIVVEDGLAAVSGSNGSNTASAYSAVHVKLDGKWLMASVRESDVPLPPAPPELQEFAWLVGDWVARGDLARVDVKYDWIGDKRFLRGETMVHPTAKNASSISGGMQITGKDPLTGQIVSWFFNGDGGHGYGVWTMSGDRWMINTQGATAEGAVTTATNVLYHPHDDVLSWQSVNRTVGDQPLPNTSEIVLERAPVSPSTK